MGIYRLILAILVVLSHLGISIAGFNPGVVAVISFYILSGYVMTLLIGRYYLHSGKVIHFYYDRGMRLFPQFWFYATFSFICVNVFSISSPFLVGMTLYKGILNYLLLPQAFFMYWGGGDSLIIPQAWSLGLEMTFYIVIPFIVIFLKDWQIYCLSLLSFVIFLFAFNNTVNTDTYGYRLLPGTLFIFLYGWLLNKNTQSSRYFRYLMFLMVFLLAITLFLKDSKFYSYPYNKEVIIGFISGSIIVGVIKNIRFLSWDEFFGNISYGVFLNHFIVIWLLEVFLKRKVTGHLEIFFLLLISITLSIFSFYFIERPFLIKRKVLRNKG